MHQAVAISAAVHVAVVAWGITREGPPPPPPAPRPPTLIEIVPAEVVAVEPEPPPLDVAIADLAPLPPAPPRTPAPHPAARPEPAIRTGPGTAIETAPGPSRGPGTDGPPGTSLLGMRGRRADLALPRGYRDDLDHAPAGTGPARDVDATGQLQPSGGGTHRSNQGVFTAKIAQDGSVDLEDARNLQVHLALPRRKQLGEGLARWYESDKGSDGKRGERALAESFHGGLDHRTTGQPEDRGNRTPTVIVPVAGGGFDVNDWLMRGKKQDPYAARKLAFLDATRDERVQIGKRHRAAQLRRTAEIMHRNLARVWAATPDPAARKQALFELWDEIADAPADDALLAAATDAARKLVIGFIRARLPRGSAHAYTPGEIAALARRQQSTATFAPYD